MSENNHDEDKTLEEFTNEFYSNLRKAMMSKEKNIADIADIMCVDTSYIYAIYSGKRKPGLRTILKICFKLNIPFKSIIPDNKRNISSLEKMNKFEKLTMDYSEDEFACIFEIIQGYNNAKKG